jgi:hypothetical protein
MRQDDIFVFPMLGAFTQKGMTLRDYFATTALVVLLPSAVGLTKDLAASAYAIADAMLEERAKEK